MNSILVFKTNSDYCTSLFGYCGHSWQLLQLQKVSPCLFTIFFPHANLTDFSQVIGLNLVQVRT